jgi:ArsR family transcriptional regulator
MRKAQVDKAAGCVKSIAHPIRLSILAILVNGERNVQDLTSALGTTQSNVSQHLAQMRGRGVLTASRRGNRTFYAVTNPKVGRLVELMKEIFCDA